MHSSRHVGRAGRPPGLVVYGRVVFVLGIRAMEHQVVTRWVTVVNPQGIHARPANMVANQSAQFTADIEIDKDGETADGKSILSILTLAAVQGTRLSVTARGPDAEQAVAALAELFEKGFEEDAAATSSADRDDGSE